MLIVVAHTNGADAHHSSIRRLLQCLVYGLLGFAANVNSGAFGRSSQAHNPWCDGNNGNTSVTGTKRKGSHPEKKNDRQVGMSIPKLNRKETGQTGAVARPRITASVSRHASCTAASSVEEPWISFSAGFFRTSSIGLLWYRSKTKKKNRQQN